MGFRQNNKRKRDQEAAFQAWIAANTEPLAQSGLPPTVTQSRDDWAYFLHFRYHDHGNWNSPPFTWIDFTWDELSHENQVVVLALEASWDAWLGSDPTLVERLPSQKLI